MFLKFLEISFKFFLNTVIINWFLAKSNFCNFVHQTTSIPQRFVEPVTTWYNWRPQGVTTGCILAIDILYCYLEFKFCYLKNMKLCLIIVKELFEHILQKQSMGFSPLKSISLRNRSLSDFRVKNTKLRRNLYLIENWLCRNKIWCVVDNYTYMCHMSAKWF